MSGRRNGWPSVGAALAVTALCALGGVAVAAVSGPQAITNPQARDSGGPYTAISRGHYLVRAGDCKSCHTAKGGIPWAGGRAVPTPFGVIYSVNITPDKSTGIGDWSFEDFYRAMHHGVDRQGNHLYPAFPYPWYTRLSRADVFAIKAYLDTLKPVRQPPTPNQLPWPFSMRSVMAVWNMLYFDAGSFQADPEKSARWNRGAYLVRGAGHCGACHSSKNFAGATDQDHPFQGGMADHVFAPDLTGDTHAGLGNWSVQDITEYLGTGSNTITSAFGPMADVVHYSTQYLSADDRKDIAIYLKSFPGKDGNDNAADQHGRKQDDASMKAGQAVYIDDCQGCHMDGGTGLAHVFPALKGGSATVVANPATLIQTVLKGAAAPVTKTRPTGLAMPAFDHKLDDAEVADVLTYIRNAWGNHAGAVSKSDVQGLRKTLNQAAR